MKEKKKNNETKQDKKPNKFLEIIKKKWLINGTKTIILVAIIIGIFIAITLGMQKLELEPLDFTKEKLYTLTDSSKEKVKNIDKEVHIYFIGTSENNSNLDLAKQYNKVNDKIIAEAIDVNNRPDLAQKYGIESGTEGIIVECGEKSKVLTSADLVTYDTKTYETINIAEEKLTSAIASITLNKVPKVYFLEGYSDFSLSQNMKLLGMYLENEINEIDTINLLTTGKVPDNCDTLVITTPNRDFDDIATKAITDYIMQGKNILWLNGAVVSKQDMPNVNKVLEMYGVKPFEVGVVLETDTSKMVTNYPDIIIPEVQYSKITEDFANTQGTLFVSATKINVDTDKLEELKVAKTDLLTTSEGAFFKTDFTNPSTTPTNGEEKGSFVIGTQLNKTIKEKNEETGEKAIESKLIIYGENNFISDYPISQNSQYSAIQLGHNNKDVVLNSIAYLVEREEDITARKDTGTVTYTATEQQSTIINVIIFTVPVLIILAGIIVWQVRRRKNRLFILELTVKRCYILFFTPLE